MTAIGIDIGGSSVKVALLDGERLVARGRSDPYARPDAEAVESAIRHAVADALRSADLDNLDASAIGLCAPGLFDPASRAITLAVNMPGLVGVNVDQLVARALDRPATRPAPVTVATDAHAAALDHWSQTRSPGRLLALSLGTGVGACVLDDGEPLTVTGRSCGHLGQMDVSMEEHAPIGPDGGRGSLEAYLGLPALKARCNAAASGNVPELLAALTITDPPIRALIRALRIAHAIYRPDEIVLLGGVGVRLGALIPQIHAQVAQDLTRLARPNWRLEAGAHDWHAAAGAARLARREWGERAGRAAAGAPES